MANIPSTNDSTRQIIDEFKNRLTSIRNDRQNLIDALQKELPSENHTIMKAKYDAEEMPNQDILLRVVINTLRKQL
jgi:translation initiation factor 2 beta subunit (eIF-2beta)/eIF-5